MHELISLWDEKKSKIQEECKPSICFDEVVSKANNETVSYFANSEIKSHEHKSLGNDEFGNEECNRDYDEIETQVVKKFVGDSDHNCQYITNIGKEQDSYKSAAKNTLLPESHSLPETTQNSQKHDVIKNYTRRNVGLSHEDESKIRSENDQILSKLDHEMVEGNYQTDPPEIVIKEISSISKTVNEMGQNLTCKSLEKEQVPSDSVCKGNVTKNIYEISGSLHEKKIYTIEENWPDKNDLPLKFDEKNSSTAEVFSQANPQEENVSVSNSVNVISEGVESIQCIGDEDLQEDPFKKCSFDECKDSDASLENLQNDHLQYDEGDNRIIDEIKNEANTGNIVDETSVLSDGFWDDISETIPLYEQKLNDAKNAINDSETTTLSVKSGNDVGEENLLDDDLKNEIGIEDTLKEKEVFDECPNNVLIDSETTALSDKAGNDVEEASFLADDLENKINIEYTLKEKELCDEISDDDFESKSFYTCATKDSKDVKQEFKTPMQEEDLRSVSFMPQQLKKIEKQIDLKNEPFFLGPNGNEENIQILDHVYPKKLSTIRYVPIKVEIVKEIHESYNKQITANDKVILENVVSNHVESPIVQTISNYPNLSKEDMQNQNHDVDCISRNQVQVLDNQSKAEFYDIENDLLSLRDTFTPYTWKAKSRSLDNINFLESVSKSSIIDAINNPYYESDDKELCIKKRNLINDDEKKNMDVECLDNQDFLMEGIQEKKEEYKLLLERNMEHFLEVLDEVDSQISTKEEEDLGENVNHKALESIEQNVTKNQEHLDFENIHGVKDENFTEEQLLDFERKFEKLLKEESEKFSLTKEHNELSESDHKPILSDKDNQMIFAIEPKDFVFTSYKKKMMRFIKELDTLQKTIGFILREFKHFIDSVTHLPSRSLEKLTKLSSNEKFLKKFMIFGLLMTTGLSLIGLLTLLILQIEELYFS